MREGSRSNGETEMSPRKVVAHRIQRRVRRGTGRTTQDLPSNQDHGQRSPGSVKKPDADGSRRNFSAAFSEYLEANMGSKPRDDGIPEPGSTSVGIARSEPDTEISFGRTLSPIGYINQSMSAKGDAGKPLGSAETKTSIITNTECTRSRASQAAKLSGLGAASRLPTTVAQSTAPYGVAARVVATTVASTSSASSPVIWARPEGLSSPCTAMLTWCFDWSRAPQDCMKQPDVHRGFDVYEVDTCSASDSTRIFSSRWICKSPPLRIQRQPGTRCTFVVRAWVDVDRGGDSESQDSRLWTSAPSQEVSLHFKPVKWETRRARNLSRGILNPLNAGGKTPRNTSSSKKSASVKTSPTRSPRRTDSIWLADAVGDVAFAKIANAIKAFEDTVASGMVLERPAPNEPNVIGASVGAVLPRPASEVSPFATRPLHSEPGKTGMTERKTENSVDSDLCAADAERHVQLWIQAVKNRMRAQADQADRMNAQVPCATRSDNLTARKP